MKNPAYLRAFLQRNGLRRYQDDSGQLPTDGDVSDDATGRSVP